MESGDQKKSSSPDPSGDQPDEQLNGEPVADEYLVIVLGLRVYGHSKNNLAKLLGTPRDKDSREWVPTQLICERMRANADGTRDFVMPVWLAKKKDFPYKRIPKDVAKQINLGTGQQFC